MKTLRTYKKLIVEIVESLCTLMLYLDEQGYRNNSKYSRYFKCHFFELKTLSNELRKRKE